MNILFDLDGVLLDTASLHATAFINAWNTIAPHHAINNAFHDTHLGARSSRQKIAILITMFEIKEDVSSAVSELKQQLTEIQLEHAVVHRNTVDALLFLKARGFRLALCSNSIRKTVLTCVDKLSQGAEPIFDVVLSGEDVRNPKPDPEIYTTALLRLGARPEDAIVFEDSVIGKAAATAAGIRVVDVASPLCITPQFVEHATNLKAPAEPRPH